MNPTHLGQIAKTLASRKSRRRVLHGLGSTVLAGVSLLQHPAQRGLAWTGPTPTSVPGTRPDFPPIFVSRSRPILRSVSGTPDTTEEQVCGIRDDSEHVEMYKGDLGVPQEFVAVHQAPVGVLRWNIADLRERFENPGDVIEAVDGWCSGTLITDDLVLTAGHCFRQDPRGWTVPRINGTDDPIPRAEIARNMSVGFNYQWAPNFSEVREQKIVKVTGLVEDQLYGLDYAIVRLAENPAPPGPGSKHARVAAADAPAGSTICVIGHPRGRQKRITTGHAATADHSTVYPDDYIYYDDLDTDGGCSGSGILSDLNGSIVGIHTNGGCQDPNAGNNHGVRIASLLRASPVLKGLAAT